MVFFRNAVPKSGLGDQRSYFACGVEALLTMPSSVPSIELEGLADTQYLKPRIDPKPGDSFYLHLSDLKLALARHATDQPITILDFGCGGSPYQGLFPNARYHRADLPQVPDIDYVINEFGRVNAPDATFDLVLSTQVLEHCPDPGVYLAEAKRVLRPGGKLLLTTHGMFEEHGCPYDFHRWTQFGLQRIVEAGGFRINCIQKLTTGDRKSTRLNSSH